MGFFPPLCLIFSTKHLATGVRESGSEREGRREEREEEEEKPARPRLVAEDCGRCVVCPGTDSSKQPPRLAGERGGREGEAEE